MVQWSENINVFNGQTFTFDYCICMIGRHSVGAIFLDLYCKSVVCCLESPEPSLSVRAQSIQASSDVTIKRQARVLRTHRQVLQ